MSLFNDKVAKLLAGHEALLMRSDYALPLPCTDCSAYSCLLAIRPERGDESFFDGTYRYECDVECRSH